MYRFYPVYMFISSKYAKFPSIKDSKDVRILLTMIIFVNISLVELLFNHGRNSHTDMGKYQAMCTWYPRIGYNFRVLVRGDLNGPNRRRFATLRNLPGRCFDENEKCFCSKYNSKYFKDDVLLDHD